MGTVGRGWQVFLVALMVAAFVVVSASAAHAVTVTFTDPMLEAAVRVESPRTGPTVSDNRR